MKPQNQHQEPRFWEVDIRVLLKWWWDDISMFLLTALTFTVLALPVIIPALLMWYLVGPNFSFSFF